VSARVLLIGWDGADWRLLDPLLERGVLPNLAALIDRGGRADLISTRPTHSWTAWPSFLTGVDPDGHGVYDILDGRGGARQVPVTYGSIRERTFIADLEQAGAASLILNVPLTFPPPAMNGKLIAGGVLPKWRTFTHPDSLAEDLRGAGTPWPINGMSWTTYRNRPEAFLDEVVEVTSARQRAMEHLLDTEPWRLAVCVYFSTDRIQHCLTSYLSPDHPDYVGLSGSPVAGRIDDVYRMLDDGLGRLVSRTGPEDLVIFMSDHGFQPVTRALHLDRLLAHLGYLSFSRSNVVFGPMQWGAVRSMARKVYDLLGLHGRVALPQSVDWAHTQAYTAVRSTGEGVSINLAGREPFGTVDPADFERVRDEIAEGLLAFADPDTGKRPVQRLWRREELFKGPHADLAPDLVLQAAPLFSLSHAKGVVEPADWLSGEHRLEGVLAAAGPAVDPGAFAGTPFRLVDLAPTILAALGVPSSVRHSGVPLHTLLGADALRAATEARLGESAREAATATESEAGLDEAEAKEVEDHLRGLGYLE
jgi:predicted AlkP superfamily phosphohydrolase/phosphomutase